MDTPVEVEETPSQPRSNFIFGSYGRVIAAGDLQGGGGKDINVVSYGPRLNETPYLELDFAYDLELDMARIRTVTTVAVADALFHHTGRFDSALTLRNAYVEASDFGVSGLSFWGGSRMYRGDDVYLLDFWPMDQLNTNGGGMAYQTANHTSVALHTGVNRLADPYQYQEITVAGPTYDTETLIFNDRVRSVSSVRVQHLFLNDGVSAKVVGWFEHQHVGPGQYRDDANIIWELAQDNGFAGGLQLGAWGFGDQSFANVFFRYATGLAAYGELALPTGLSNGRTVANARLARVATSFNYEVGSLGLMGGAYFQRFDDADDNRYDRDDYNEGAIALRPMIYLGDHFRQGFEFSYQARRTDGLDPRTDTFLVPSIIKLAVIPSLSLMRGTYQRPELRAIYSISMLNDGAQNLFPEDDPRHTDTIHFLGVGAEWWFNSNSYR